ncbi:hypothetical protein D3C84_959270 [compost metagenome]
MHFEYIDLYRIWIFQTAAYALQVISFVFLLKVSQELLATLLVRVYNPYFRNYKNANRFWG